MALSFNSRFSAAVSDRISYILTHKFKILRIYDDITYPFVDRIFYVEVHQ